MLKSGVLLASFGLAATLPAPAAAQPPGYLFQWGSTGNGPGQFRSPTTAAVDASQNVYVADAHNNRIQKFTSTGAYIGQWDNGGLAFGVAVGAGGTVYVSGGGSIRVYTSSGAYLNQWG